MSPKKPDVSLTEARDTSEAINYIFIGVKFFLLKHTLKTLLVLMLMAVGPIYVGWDYFTSAKVKIEKALPLDEDTGWRFSIMPEAYASTGEKPNEIRIDGKLYGYYDPLFTVYVMQGRQKLFIYDKETRESIVMKIPELGSQTKE